MLPRAAFIWSKIHYYFCFFNFAFFKYKTIKSNRQNTKWNAYCTHTHGGGVQYKRYKNQHYQIMWYCFYIIQKFRFDQIIHLSLSMITWSSLMVDRGNCPITDKSTWHINVWFLFQCNTFFSYYHQQFIIKLLFSIIIIKAEFLASLLQFSVTWSFRNHSNMLIWCSKLSYQCWKQFCCLI